MENIFVEFLPPWVETGLQPAFYDKESGTVLQQTARMYDRVNMLVRMFNKLSKNTKEEIEDFEQSVNDTVDDYIERFNSLYNYVHDYFDNLDVQQEINNKLDDMVEAGTLQEIIDSYLNSKAVFGFDTVADMQASENLIDGSYAETLGYYAKNDGGSSLYKIRTITVDDTVDGGTIIAMDDDTLVAELVYDNELNVAQFGAKGDGTTDDTTKIQAMVSKLTSGMTGKFVPNKIYLVSDTIDVPYRVNLDGQGCFIKLDDSLTSNGYTFRYGMTNASTAEDSLLLEYQIKNFNIYHFGVISLHYYNGIYVNKDVHISNIYTWGLNKVVACSNAYIDMVKIDHINIWGKYGNDFAIDTGFLGDNRIIESIHQYVVFDNGGQFNTVKVGSGHNTVKVDGVINGAISITGSNVELANIHLEAGNITISAKAEVNAHNLYLWKEAGVYPISITAQSKVNISDMIISYRDNTEDYSSDNCIDINSTNDYTILTINNCYKVIQSDDITFKNYAGINTNIDDFNLNLTNNSKSSVISKIALNPIPAYKRIGSYSILGNFYKDNNYKWKLTTGTYYYKAIMMFDPVRLVGNNSNTNELNSSLTNGEAGTYLTINGVAYSNYRIYRGTTTGSYDNYSDIGVCDNHITDNGYIVNCNKWTSREAGAVDTILNADKYEIVSNNLVKVYAGSAPSVGTWKKGDVIINNNPTAGGASGWICTTAGTPGTWKALASIEA